MDQGKKIADLRKEKGLTQAELGNELHVSFQAVSKWERGESAPDFDTMCRISKYFNVPLEFFSDESETNIDNARESARVQGETVPAQQPETPVAVQQPQPMQTATQTSAVPQRELMGICKICGRSVYKGDEAQYHGQFCCKKCRDEKERKDNAEREHQRRVREAELQKVKKRVPRGLWWSLFITAALAIITICSIENKDTSTIIPIVVISVIFIYPYIAQLFWDGVIVNVTLAGGRTIGTPGIIFSFDWDGFKFLIAMKILFAVLRFIIYIATLLITVVAAIVIAPFTFFPCMIKLNRGEELG